MQPLIQLLIDKIAKILQQNWVSFRLSGIVSELLSWSVSSIA